MRIISTLRSSLFAVVLLAISATAYRADQRLHLIRPARVAGLRATSLSRRWLSLDAGLLGLRRRRLRLLLGAGHLGHGSGTRSALDSGVLGLEQQRICLQPRLLGSAGWLLWRSQLRLHGYYGDGYQGGRWQGGQFYYNRSVSNVNITNIHNVYNTTVINTHREPRQLQRR